MRRTSVQLNIAPDRKQVIMFSQPASEQSSGNVHATFLLNVFEELRWRVPLGR
jgi:hypothetical protein